LIVVLVIVLILGAVFTLRNLTRNKTTAEAAAPKTVPAVASVPGATPAAKPANTALPVVGLVSQAPTAPLAPAAAPAPSAPAASPTTHPAAGSPMLAESHPRPALSAEQVGAALRDGKAKLDAGELIAARKLLNDAFQSGKLSDTDEQQAKSMLSQISQTVIFSPKRFPNDEYGGIYTVPPGGVLARIGASHNVTWELLARINNISPRKLRAGQTIKMIEGPFHAVVNKKAFTLDVYLHALPGQAGSLYVTTLRVGLGRNDSTPTGLWQVQPGGKLKNPKFWGVADLPPVEAGDPNNPLGHYWIALNGLHGNAVGQQSYGIHGTNEPNTIGTQSSHGCIRLADADIELVYELLVDGKSTVLVRD
jgi:lipoprotein-anchoring transpeptidase ErfK/SrfK